ncbi:MAG: LysR family transcriptional regulator [Pseudomonadota bacterium]
MNWDDLKVALAVGRTGSLTRAALQLGINQSTATRRLVALEAELGSTLFVRSQGGLTPTESGRAAIARAGEVERRVERLLEQVNETGKGPAGVVYLRGNNWVINRLIETSLKEFLSAHPGIEIRIVGHYASQPIQQSASVSIWFERLPRTMEFAVKLGMISYAVYGPEEGEAPPEDWVSFFDEEVPRTAPSRTTDKLRGSSGRLRVTASDASLIGTAIGAGAGRGLLPMCLGEGHARLRRVGSGPPELRRELSLHLHPDTVQTARVQAVIRWVRESFAETFAPCDTG